MNGAAKDFVKRAKKAGWEVRPGRHKHIHLVWPPTGEFVVTSQTPSDNRALRNAEAVMARISGRRLTQPKGNGKSKAQKQRYRELEAARLAARRRRRAAPVHEVPPRTTVMADAFDDFFAEVAPGTPEIIDNTSTIETTEDMRDVG